MLKRVFAAPAASPLRRSVSNALLYTHRFHTPVGTILAVSDGDHLHAIDFGDYELRLRTLLKRRLGPVNMVEGEDPLGIETAFQAYFRGDLAALNRLPVAFTGTPFQNQVWLALQDVPPSETQTYGELSRRLGNPHGQRAVGFAVGQNPIAIVVPCHRIVGSDGALTGYAGGIPRKRWLLEHEQRYAKPVDRTLN